jgi:hypothetical protein
MSSKWIPQRECALSKGRSGEIAILNRFKRYRAPLVLTVITRNGKFKINNRVLVEEHRETLPCARIRSNHTVQVDAFTRFFWPKEKPTEQFHLTLRDKTQLYFAGNSDRGFFLCRDHNKVHYSEVWKIRIDIKSSLPWLAFYRQLFNHFNLGTDLYHYLMEFL